MQRLNIAGACAVVGVASIEVGNITVLSVVYVRLLVAVVVLCVRAVCESWRLLVFGLVDEPIGSEAPAF